MIISFYNNETGSSVAIDWNISRSVQRTNT